MQRGSPSSTRGSCPTLFGDLGAFHAVQRSHLPAWEGEGVGSQLIQVVPRSLSAVVCVVSSVLRCCHGSPGAFEGSRLRWLGLCLQVVIRQGGVW